jgi:SAM-dependent methyltransferase
MAIPNNCPLCNAGKNHQIVVTSHVYGDNSNSRAFYHCLLCDVRFQYPSLTPEEEVKFYNSEFESFMTSRSGDGGGWQGAESHIHSNESTKKRRMKYLSPHIIPEANILEIGCSSGFMLFPFYENGHDCIGIEPSGFFSAYVKNRGIEVFNSLEQLSIERPGKKFDIITHFFVLEHISQPLEFLRNQIELLNKGGKIIFEIPNVSDALHSIYDIPAFERFYWSIAHPWYFSEKSLEFLLENLDEPYEIFFDQRYDLSNHLTWARDGKPGGMGKYTKALGVELEEFYKESLIKNKFCDTLIGVITKS